MASVAGRLGTDAGETRPHERAGHSRTALCSTPDQDRRRGRGGRAALCDRSWPAASCPGNPLGACEVIVVSCVASTLAYPRQPLAALAHPSPRRHTCGCGVAGGGSPVRRPRRCTCLAKIDPASGRVVRIYTYRSHDPQYLAGIQFLAVGRVAARRRAEGQYGHWQANRPGRPRRVLWRAVRPIYSSQSAMRVPIQDRLIRIDPNKSSG